MRTIFRCPNSGTVRERWIHSIKSHQTLSVADERSLYYSVCNLHFDAGQIYNGVKPRLKPGTFPTIFPVKNVSAEIMVNNDETILAKNNDQLLSTSSQSIAQIEQ